MRDMVVNTVIWPFISEITFAVERDGYSTLVDLAMYVCTYRFRQTSDSVGGGVL